MAGALEGLRIIEIAGLGPAPFCGMMLADHGADVIRIDRPGGVKGAMGDPAKDPLQRSRKSIALDLKQPEAVAVVRDLCRSADGLIEGFRPGVMERLGLGPDVLLGDNPKLVYGRMTGWGQDGPLGQAVGHDINYIALAGALAACGRAGERPVPPLNLVGDFGGGGMLLAFGMLAGLTAAARTGRGQVVDCAMVDGTTLLMSMIYGFHAAGMWRNERGRNLLDTGAHFYDVYECADGKFVSIGAIEPQFYAELRRLTGLADDPAFDRQHDPAAWPMLAERLAEIFRTRTQAEWCDLIGDHEVCFAPVLDLEEAPRHPHNVARGTFGEPGGVVQPMPAPRFSATPPPIPQPAQSPGSDGDAILTGLGYRAEQLLRLRESGVLF